VIAGVAIRVAGGRPGGEADPRAAAAAQDELVAEVDDARYAPRSRLSP
jgi:hypothetical protein